VILFNPLFKIGTAMSQQGKRQIQKQQGFTLVELSITLVLIAGFILSGLYFVQRIQTENAINKTTADAGISMNAAIAATAGDASTSGHTVASLAAMNVWPKDRLVISAAGLVTGVTGSFPGSTETMLPNTAIGTVMPAGQGFIYTINNIPAEACATLAKNLSLHPNTVQVQAGPAGTGALAMLRASTATTITPASLTPVAACGGTAAKRVVVNFNK
jgi:prepilin-type N-terminal cleavage/methylation domain-containing protein